MCAGGGRGEHGETEQIPAAEPHTLHCQGVQVSRWVGVQVSLGMGVEETRSVEGWELRSLGQFSGGS